LHSAARREAPPALRSRKFTDKEGVERYAFEVIAIEVPFLDRAERQKPEDAAPPVGREDNPF
jgi:hypothetical protein